MISPFFFILTLSPLCERGFRASVRRAVKNKSPLLWCVRLRLARHILPSIDGKIASFLNGLRRYLTSEDGKLALTESCDSSDLFAARSRCNKKQSTTKVVLCFLWSGLRGSNPPPSPWQGDALPNELNPHWWCLRSESNQRHGDFQSPALPTELQRHTARAV